MIHLLSVKHHWHRLLVLGLLGASMLISVCDDYNIVEPRFYNADDLVELVECDWDRYTESIGAADNLSIVSTPKEVSTAATVDGCWYNRYGHRLVVTFQVPVSNQVKISILNSSGGVKWILFDRKSLGGWVSVPWVDEDDGVYAISMQTELETVVVWFEVK